MSEDIFSQFQNFLKSLPDDTDWAVLRREFPKMITAEKNNRAGHFCVICTSDIDKLESAGGNIDLLKLRKSIKERSPKLNYKELSIRPFVCDAHWEGFNVAAAILKNEDLKEQSIIRQAEQKRQKEHRRYLELVEWIDSKGKRGKGTPSKAFNVLLQTHREFDSKRFSEMPYQQFLASNYWFVVSSYAKYKAGNKCALCPNRYPLNTHHKTYAHRGQELHHMDDLIVLCQKCHQHHHNSEA